MRWRAVGALAAGLLALAATEVAFAERRYIIEQLVVSVSSEPLGGDRVGTLKSGDGVEFLERVGDFARVRLASGTEGWVKASYLMAELPLRERLAAREHELEALRSEFEALQTKVATPRPAEAGATAAAVAAARRASGAPPLLAVRDPAGGPEWVPTAVAALVALALGFALGWGVLDRRIRRKYGGLKIY